MDATEKNPVVIVDTCRTPIGDFQGLLASLNSVTLGQTVIQKLIERTQLSPDCIDEVIMGCVLQAGQGQAPARQAALNAGLPHAVGATTLNKMCGSGMKAMMLGHDMLMAGTARAIIAGGMESMSNAPYLLPKARAGYRMGHQAVQDHLFLDGLEDAYEQGQLMGLFAEQTATARSLTRSQQDEFTLTSLARAQKAISSGAFTHEIVPVTLKTKGQSTDIATDQLPLKAKPEKIPLLKPAFAKQGTVTAANSSAISDGAAAHLLMRADFASAQQLSPLAIIRGHASFAQAPAAFTTAPAGAITRLLKQLEWAATDVDLYEINEAFAVVTLAAMETLSLDPTKVNIHGGACALGHPIGASGARIVTTLAHALKLKGLKRGIATACIGGGEATAIAIECC